MTTSAVTVSSSATNAPLELHEAQHRAPRRVTLAVWEWLLLLMAPPAAWLVLGIVLINQDRQIDAWFYLGYGRAFHALHDLFGWPYYSVRFPVVALNGVFLSGAHPLIGYAVLRYLLLLACGVPLYIWANREFGRVVAVLAYLFLFCNPLLPRVMLWDLTPFISVPMALAGMIIWLWSDSVGGRFVSGFLLMASIASHAFTGTAIAAFLTVQMMRRLLAMEIGRFVLRDIAATAAGAAVCFGAGCLYYYARVGPFDPWVIISITMDAVRAGHEYAETHRTAFSVWGAREYQIYVPMLCVALCGVLLGRRLFQNTAVAGLWWFGLIYTAAYLAYQFVAGRFVLETFYYFAHLTLVVYLLVPVIIFELMGRRQEVARRVAIAGAIGLLALPLANRVIPAFGPWLEKAAAGSTFAVLVGVVAASLIFVAGARVLVRRAGPAPAVCVFLLLVQLLTLLNPTHRRVFDTRYRARETGVYVAAVQMLDVVASKVTPDTRLILWFCSNEGTVLSLASTVLLYGVSSPWSPEPCDARIGDYERTQLATNPRYVLMVGEQPAAFAQEEASLREQGYRVNLRLAKTIGDDAYHAGIRLVEIEKASR